MTDDTDSMKALLKPFILEILADQTVTPDEVDKTVYALNGALNIMDKQAEREKTIVAAYEDKLKDKDKQTLKLMAAFATAVIINTVLILVVAGLSFLSILLMLGQVAVAIIIGIVIAWLKEHAPIVLDLLQKGTDVVRPILPAPVQQGIATIGKVVDADAAPPPVQPGPDPQPEHPA